MKDLSKLSETDIAYIAGVLERCVFSITKLNRSTENAYRVFILLSFPDATLIKWLIENVGGKSLRNSKIQKMARWDLSGKDCINLLSLCYKFLKAKKRHANVFILYGSTFKKRGTKSFLVKNTRQSHSPHEIAFRKELYNEIRYLNSNSDHSPQSRKQKHLLNDIPAVASGLFNFTDDFDGFGETLSVNSGFFDEFINNLIEIEDENN